MQIRLFEADVRAQIGPDRCEVDVPLAPLTTFRVGGPADCVVVVRTAAELSTVLFLATTHNVPVTMLGGGSNVIVSDRGVRGVVVRPLLTNVSHVSDCVVRAEAGITINGLVRWTISRGLAGIEDWAGTPGTIGGAIFGNAHWKGRNIGDVVSQAMLMAPDGRQRLVPAAEMRFGYDTSRLQTSGEALVWADVAVAPGRADLLRTQARASLAFRKHTQPLAKPSAGCIFQNPDASRDHLPAGMPPSAGALVDRAGLKGTSIGGASISEIHANFVVNDGHATASDIRALAESARAAVLERFGVLLRDEVVWLGAF